jgi:hypothetical protein
MPASIDFDASRATDESILDLIENCLAQSMLIFMLADLRLLSATGRISTKYETLSIDSDRVVKGSADEIAGLLPLPLRTGWSISPAHIMTVLFIEIMNEVNGRKKNESSVQSSILIDENQNGLLGGATGYLKRNAMLKQAEGDMHDLIRGYAKGLRRDLKNDTTEAELAAKSKAPHLQKMKDKFKSMRNLHFHKSQLMRSRTNLDLLETMDTLEGIQNSIVDNAQGAVMSSLQNSFSEGSVGASYPTGMEDEKDVDEKDLLRKMMEAAVRSRDVEQLHFVKDFFKEGSISRVMAESTSQLVWLHDWFPTKECTYAISVDVVTKKVLVVFRGAITRADWSHAYDSNLRNYSNPIAEEYKGKTKKIRLHNGFHRYLFRERKDTGTTKFDEICGKLDQYGVKMIGEEYKVSVTGHSLGGALATLFSFYASCDDRFIRNAPIQVVSIGCPYVCGYSMAHAFRHQEQVGKLRYIRVHNVRDGVPHLPLFLLQFTRHGAVYHHVGVDVRLPMIRKHVFKILPKNRCRVAYTRELTPFISWLRQARDAYLWNTPMRPWKFGQAHTLVEHQERLLYVDEKKTPLLFKSLEDVYEIFRSEKRKCWYATDSSTGK